MNLNLHGISWHRPVFNSFYFVRVCDRLQNSRSGSSARSAEFSGASRASREPHTPEGRVRQEKPTVAFPYNEFVLSRGLEKVWIMLPRYQTMSVSCLIFIDNSTHMLNLILSMISCRTKNNSDRSQTNSRALVFTVVF